MGFLQKIWGLIPSGRWRVVSTTGRVVLTTMTKRKAQAFADEMNERCKAMHLKHRYDLEWM